MTLFHCDHCNQDKPESDFYTYAKRKCKGCFKSYRQWYEKAFPEKVAAKHSRQWVKNRDKHLAKRRQNPIRRKLTDSDKVQLRNWRKNHRIEWNAKARVRYAVLTGDIIRPEACQKCAHHCRPQAHHEDYAKPLDVQWLCASCHKRRHKEMDALGIAPLNGTPRIVPHGTITAPHPSASSHTNRIHLQES